MAWAKRQRRDGDRQCGGDQCEGEEMRVACPACKQHPRRGEGEDQRERRDPGPAFQRIDGKTRGGDQGEVVVEKFRCVALAANKEGRGG